ncbi:CapA family protein [Salinibacillus xinjiangensis]|uniref:CapA family protein n=1 Tax=Salinibacillus xinjiangensis TaxID=1229268 RepID=A0A6G1X3N0_9BACI|nr:CapA family protein [Salinibacillus xinjiangensis]MRG85603.1 CapA family protein [Salinibacillus xinjiangensis]
MKRGIIFGMIILISWLFITGLQALIGDKEKRIYAYHISYETAIDKKYFPAHAAFQLLPQEPITLLFAGDTLFDWSVKTAVQQYGPDYPFQYVKEEVSQADLSILNLETAVTKEKEKDTVQLYNFKSDPIALKGVKNTGFDMVSLANNHAMDYQIDGFLDTLKHLEQNNLKYFGAGKNKDKAYSAQQIVLKGRTIKLLGFSRFLPAVRWYEGEGPVIASAYQKDRVLETIKREAQDTDYLCVYIHWGVEGNNRPENWQRQYAREMIEAGADAIIGAHPHVLQGFEYYKEKPIAYSLGNFLFPDYVQGRTAETGLLTLTLDGNVIKMSFNPYYIRANQIHPLEGQEHTRLLNYLEDISYNVEMDGMEIQPLE